MNGKMKHIISRDMIMVIGIALLASMPTFAMAIHNGHDLQFHLMRIEGLAAGMRQGQFPVRLESIWNDKYGYATLFYGDLLLYIPALLRLLGVTINDAYNAYILLMNVLTVAISYRCFDAMVKNKDIALLMTAAYVTSAYRLMDIYVRAAVGEYSAMIFLPLIAYAMYRLYHSEEQRKLDYKGILLLIIGMTGVLQTHILTTEMVVLVLALYVILNFKVTKQIKTIESLALAVVGTVLLNLWFIIPWLDYYLNVPVRITDSAGQVKWIQQNGAYIGQYFAVFQNIFGEANIKVTERMNLSPGLMLMLVFMTAGVLWLKGHASDMTRKLCVVSGITLFAASDMFPWNWLAEHSQLGNMLAEIQFPWRWIGFSCLFLTLLLACVVMDLKSVFSGETAKMGLSCLTAGLICIGAMFFVSNYYNGANLTYLTDASQLDHSYEANEYMRAGSSMDVAAHDVQGTNLQQLKLISHNGTSVKVYCKTGSDASGEVILPVFNYKGYVLRNSEGEICEIHDSGNKEVAFTVPANYDGKYYLTFEFPWYWRLGDIVSLCSVVVLALAGLRYKLKVKR